MSYKRRMIFPVAGMVIILSYAALSFCEMAAKARVTAFTGGMFEASGVVHAPGTDGVLFVDDGRPNEIFWMRLDLPTASSMAFSRRVTAT